MNTKIVKIGDELGVCLPESMLKELDWARW